MIKVKKVERENTHSNQIRSSSSYQKKVRSQSRKQKKSFTYSTNNIFNRTMGQMASKSKRDDFSSMTKKKQGSILSNSKGRKPTDIINNPFSFNSREISPNPAGVAPNSMMNVPM
mmetsp:Transcript_559/g.1081  ORF Transcript_559/g.1081 Transcript_559/m.1081 type:complete len:115 (+) Transcript_559:454-798(+)